MNKQRKVLITTTYNDMGIIVDTKAEECMGELPAANVRPVVRAMNKSEDGFLCSACSVGDFGGFHGYKPNYCPNCGARMKGADDNQHIWDSYKSL